MAAPHEIRRSGGAGRVWELAGPGPELRAARRLGAVAGTAAVVGWRGCVRLGRWCRRHPVITWLIVGAGVSWLVGGWVQLVLWAIGHLGLVWLALTRWPDAIRAAVARLNPRSDQPAAPGQAVEPQHSRPRPHEGEPMVRWHEVGRDPATGRALFVPLIEATDDPDGGWLT